MRNMEYSISCMFICNSFFSFVQGFILAQKYYNLILFYLYVFNVFGYYKCVFNLFWVGKSVIIIKLNIRLLLQHINQFGGISNNCIIYLFLILIIFQFVNYYLFFYIFSDYNVCCNIYRIFYNKELNMVNRNALRMEYLVYYLNINGRYLDWIT